MVTLPSASGTRSIIAVCHQVTIALLHMMKRPRSGLQNAEVVRYFINQNPVMESVLRIARTPRLMAKVVGTATRTVVSMIMVSVICAGISAVAHPAPVGTPRCLETVLSTAAHLTRTTVAMNTLLAVIISTLFSKGVTMAKSLADQTDVMAIVTTPTNTAQN